MSDRIGGEGGLYPGELDRGGLRCPMQITVPPPTTGSEKGSELRKLRLKAAKGGVKRCLLRDHYISILGEIPTDYGSKRSTVFSLGVPKIARGEGRLFSPFLSGNYWEKIPK